MSTDTLTKRVADRAKVPGDLRSVIGRMERHLKAWRLSAGLAALGFSAELVAMLTGEQLLVTCMVALSSLGTAAVAASKARAQSDAKGRRTLVGGLSSATWLTLASLGAPAAPLVATLMVGTLTLNARRFHTIRIPYPDPQPALEAAPEPKALEAGVDQYVAVWDDHVGGSAGALPGSYLFDPAKFEHGVTYGGQLSRGKQEFGSITMALPRIASGLDIPMERLVFDPNPKKPSRFTLKVVERSPIEAPVLFDGPRYDDGRIMLGPHADGLGEAFFRLYVPDGIRGGAIYGGSGIGKSRLIEVVALTAQACTPTVILYIDGQDGGSSSALYEHATWAGGPGEARDMLAAIERMQRYRQKFNRLHRLDGFNPSPELPGILVIVDECHRIFDDKTAKRWGFIARECRKVGIAVVAATQNPNADSLGNNEALRQSLQDGNTIVARCQSRTASIVIPGIDIDLAKLPAMPGYGVPTAVGPQYGRTAPFRNRWLLTQSNIDDNPNLAGNLTVHDWFARTPQHALDAGTANAAGRIFTNRKAIAAQRRAELEAEMEALANGTLDFDDEDEEPGARFVPPNAAAATDVRSNVVAFPTIGAPAEPNITNLTPGECTVLVAVAEGRGTPADWQAEGLSESGARKCRDSLTARGLIVRAGHGRYETTQAGLGLVELADSAARKSG